MNVNIILPPRSYFNKTHININGRPKTKKHISDLFWHSNEIAGHLIPVTCHLRTQVRDIIRQIFFVNPRETIHADEKTLVIHIRSGDIFRSKNPHPDYIMPPLCFYTNIIKELGDQIDKIHLIAEDAFNPCINLLQEKYPNLVFKKSSLDEDVKVIMGAKRIVYGAGTFIPELLAVFNDSFTEIYRSSNAYKPSLLVKHSYKDNVIDISDYIDKMGSWKNTPEQCQLMCDYVF